MDRSRLVPQLYGYAVCLVCVITILVASNNVIDGVFDTTTPEMSREVSGSLGGSFEMYRQQRMQMRPEPGVPVTTGNVPDSVLRAAYQDELDYRIRSVRHHGMRRIVGSGLTLLIAVAFFVTHWRWLRRPGGVEAA